MRRFIASIAVGLFLVGCEDVPSPTTVDDGINSPSQSSFQFQYADHYIVSYSGASMPDEAAEFVRERGGEVTRDLPAIGRAVVNGISDGDLDLLSRFDLLDRVTRDIIVRWIPASEANFNEAVYETLELPETETDQSGAFFFDFFQWNMRVIDADDAWHVTNQGSGTTVAVLDTGVDPNHIDLAGKIDGASTSVLSFSPCGSPDINTINDLNFHGSFVSGLVASNGIGMASVAPDASILAVKVLNCAGFGSFGDIANGIVYATNNGADVINMSLGALIPTDTGDDVLDQILEDLIDLQQDAVDFATDNGVFVVAASGNAALNFDDLPEQGTCPPGASFPATFESCDEVDIIHVPSMLDNVLSVGATAPVGQANFDQLASYTNFGENGNDVVAPGGDLVAGGSCNLIGIGGGGGPFTCDLVLSVCSSFQIALPFSCGIGSFVLSAGTSFASPHAAGAAAVAIGDGEEGECVEGGADEIGPEELFPEGRINVLGAAACETLSTD